MTTPARTTPVLAPPPEPPPGWVLDKVMGGGYRCHHPERKATTLVYIQQRPGLSKSDQKHAADDPQAAAVAAAWELERAYQEWQADPLAFRRRRMRERGSARTATGWEHAVESSE